MQYLVLFYPLLYALSIYFEALGYQSRNKSRTEVAKGYNLHQKYVFIGRFGPLLGLPIIGMSIDNGLNVAYLLMTVSVGHLLGSVCYFYKDAGIFRPSLRGLIWALGIAFHAMGLHVLFVLSSLFFEYRATILLCSAAINGLGSFIVIYVVENDIARELDINEDQKKYIMHQAIRAYVHFIAFACFLILGLFFYE